MSHRRILVIGSQCEALGKLKFLPEAAQDLYAVMSDPKLGACSSAIEGDGLLIDPTVTEMKAAIKSAYLRAAKDEARLFIAYIGHGEKSDKGDDYYLLPNDAEIPPDSDTAVHLTNIIKEIHRKAQGRVDGLGMLVDACYSGEAGFAATQAWAGGLQGTLRFEILTAAADRPAADGCFSRTLVKLLRAGLSSVPSEHLLCAHVRPLIEKRCPNQVPQHPTYNADDTLWLVRNTGRVIESWAQTSTAEEIQRLTHYYQPTAALNELVKRSNKHPLLMVVAEAGAGKSAFSAALAWPKITESIVPTGFVQAIHFLTEATTPQELARSVGKQLARAVPGFEEAQLALAQTKSDTEQRKLGILERQIVEPLRSLKPKIAVRIVLDGLDRVSINASGSVWAAIESLARLQFMRLVVTARPDTSVPVHPAVYFVPRAADSDVLQYLQKRGTPATRIDRVIKTAEGNWLIARVLADVLKEKPDADIRAEGQLALSDAYEELLLRSGAKNEETQRVLQVLAAAGSGPLLPFPILCGATSVLGGPSTGAGVHDHLVKLRGLVTRTGAGTEREHVGLFHQTLISHIGNQTDLTHAHEAIIQSIDTIAPLNKPFHDELIYFPDDLPVQGPVQTVADLSDPVQRYAFEREAIHLLAVGEIDVAVKRLIGRLSPVPRDNLRRLQFWRSYFKRWPAWNIFTLVILDAVAFWTGECGSYDESLRLFNSLLKREKQFLGPDHLNTLRTEVNRAATVMYFDQSKAIKLFTKLLPRLDRVLGYNNPITILARTHLATLKGEKAELSSVLNQLNKLLISQKRVCGRYDRETLTTRYHIADVIGECKQSQRALRLFRALLPWHEQVFGRDDRQTLSVRKNIAIYTDECGDTAQALATFETLLPDAERVLGQGHPDTTEIREWIKLLKLAIEMQSLKARRRNTD
ncbi:MAG: caspase family protein [Xanthobacteraceae bacterium]